MIIKGLLSESRGLRIIKFKTIIKERLLILIIKGVDCCIRSLNLLLL